MPLFTARADTSALEVTGQRDFPRHRFHGNPMLVGLCVMPAIVNPVFMMRGAPLTWLMPLAWAMLMLCLWLASRYHRQNPWMRHDGDGLIFYGSSAAERMRVEQSDIKFIRVRPQSFFKPHHISVCLHNGETRHPKVLVPAKDLFKLVRYLKWHGVPVEEV